MSMKCQRKKLGRPRLTTHGSTVQSSSSSNPSMNTEGGSSTSLQPQTLSALETLPLTEIMQGNHLRTLRDADVCVRRLGHELHLLERQCLSDVVDARRLLRDLFRICALQDHILITADSLPREESVSLRSKVIKAAAMQLATRIFRLHALLSSRPLLSSVLDFDEPASNQSTNPIEPSLQSSLPILHASSLLDGPPSTLLQQQAQQSPLCESNIENASAQDARSSVSIGSATSAPSFNHRITLLAELKAAQKEAAQARKKIEDAEKVAAEAEKVAAQAQKESEEAKQLMTKTNAKKDAKYKALKDAIRRMTRRKKSSARGMTLTHSDGTTSRLHNVRNVFR